MINCGNLRSLMIYIRCTVVLSLLGIIVLIGNEWRSIPSIYWNAIPDLTKLNIGTIGWPVAAFIGMPAFIASFTHRQRTSIILGLSSMLLGLVLLCWIFYRELIAAFLSSRDYLMPVMCLQIVYWGPPMALGLLALIFAFTSRFMPRYPIGHCQSCGYNLFGNVSGRCPECGTVIQQIAQGATT